MSDLDKAIERLRSASFLEGGDPEFDGADPVEDVRLVLSEIASLRAQLADFQRTAWLILRSCTFDGGYVAVERSTVAEFDPGKSILESWTDVKDGTYCFRARVALSDEQGK